MSMDSSELEQLAYDLGRVPAEVVPKVKAVVSKGALNIKKQMVKDLSGSRSFGHIARTVNYDVTESGEGVEAEIGPDRSVRTGPKGSSASLAGIAYFGNSRGGGATVPDPQHALDDEEPRFVEQIAKIAGFVFDP